MDRRTLSAILLCFAIFIGWQKFYIEPRMPAPTTSPAQQQLGSQATAQSAVSSQPVQTNPAPVTPAAQHPAQTLALESGTGTVTIADDGKFLKEWRLKNYHTQLSDESPAISLPWVTHQDSAVEFAFEDPSLAYLSKVQGDLAQTPKGALWTYEDANVKMTREFIIQKDLPYIDLKISAQFKTKHPSYAFLSLGAQKAAEKDSEEQDRQLVYFTNQAIERVHLKDATNVKEVATPVKYIGATSRYFVLSLVAQGSVEPKALIQPTAPGSARASLVYPVADNAVTIPVRLYFGPKELNILRSVEPTLDHTVDFGWFTVFAYPIMQLLKWLYGFVGNYGVAIILLTLLLKLLTFPLTYKSMKSMKEMARLQPQLQKLRDKYKDDKQALNQEMLVLMRSHGYNPVAGCLPILIQMPIFFALYRVLYSSIDLYHAPFSLWIHDLSAPDRFYVTPVLLSLTMFIQQKLTPNTATDPAQAKMLQLMPLIFGAFMLALPSGLTVYMLVNALASIIQQLILNKKLDIGHAPPVPARSR
jgi:YidC/Oxa1 family membrane protein insertase